MNEQPRKSISMKLLLASLVIIVAVISAYGIYVWQQQKIEKLENQISQLNQRLDTVKPSEQAPILINKYSSKKGVSIYVYTPASNAEVANPVIVMGEVPGNWSFEASFPIKLLDSKGNVIAQAPAQLLGDWMTEKLVPFSAKLNFTNSPNGNGTLLLQKDNPSGLEKNDDSVSIPIRL